MIDTSPREIAIVGCIVAAMLASGYILSHTFEGHQPNRRLRRRNERRELWSLAVLFVSVGAGITLLMGGA
jgi:hypothetical protein